MRAVVCSWFALKHRGLKNKPVQIKPMNGVSSSSMILCITPNPAIDRTINIPALDPGQIHRAQEVMIAAGGKGVNVARTIRRLGGETLCMGFAGGHNGHLLSDLTQNESLNPHWTWTNAERGPVPS